jgi:hypothetical protein
MVESQAFQRSLAVYFSNRFLRPNRRLAAFVVAPVMALLAVVTGSDERRQTGTRIVTSSMMAPLSRTGETPPMKGQVPQAILDPILKEAAALDREQLVIVRAESVVWNDGSIVPLLFNYACASGCLESSLSRSATWLAASLCFLHAKGLHDYTQGRRPSGGLSSVRHSD